MLNTKSLSRLVERFVAFPFFDASHHKVSELVHKGYHDVAGRGVQGTKSHWLADARNRMQSLKQRVAHERNERVEKRQNGQPNKRGLANSKHRNEVHQGAQPSKKKQAVMDPGLALMCRREERSRKTGNIPKMFMEEYEHTQIRTLFVSSEHKKNLWR